MTRITHVMVQTDQWCTACGGNGVAERALERSRPGHDICPVCRGYKFVREFRPIEEVFIEGEARRDGIFRERDRMRAQTIVDATEKERAAKEHARDLAHECSFGGNLDRLGNDYCKQCGTTKKEKKERSMAVEEETNPRVPGADLEHINLILKNFGATDVVMVRPLMLRMLSEECASHRKIFAGLEVLIDSHQGIIDARSPEEADRALYRSTDARRDLLRAMANHKALLAAHDSHAQKKWKSTLAVTCPKCNGSGSSIVGGGPNDPGCAHCGAKGSVPV